MVVGKSKCPNCGIIYKWRTTYYDPPPQSCSFKCRFKWKTATEQQKLERAKKSFEKRVIKKDGCWNWNGSFDKDGYSKMTVKTNMGFNRAHITSWKIHNGKIPEGLCVLHKCDNPSCTNPEHLFLGTAKDNTQDMIKKGRDGFNIWNQLGSLNPQSKLDENKVKEIKKMIQKGLKSLEISLKFNVSRRTITDIRLNKSWKQVEI